MNEIERVREALTEIMHAGYPKYPNVATPFQLQEIAMKALPLLDHLEKRLLAAEKVVALAEKYFKDVPNVIQTTRAEREMYDSLTVYNEAKEKA